MIRIFDFRILVLSTLLLIFVSCAKFDNVEEQIESVEKKIESLLQAKEALQTAKNSGEVITEVIAIDEGYQISFYDSTSITIYHGNNGIIPFLMMGSDGFWTVSYDNGDTFYKLLDDQGNHLRGFGIDGTSVRVIEDNSGNYAFELYNSANPDIITDTIITPLTSQKSKIINLIEQNNENNTITITIANGDSFTFDKKKIVVSSIAILENSPLIIGKEGVVTVEFRVTPSNATFRHNLDSVNSEIYIDLVKETKSHVTTPSNYKLSKIEPVYNEQGILKTGQYRAYITDLGVSSSYNDIIALVINTEDENNANIEVSSSAIEIKFTNNTISEFKFLTSNNVGSVIEDVTAIIEDDEIRIISPYISSVTSLVANFSTNGYKVLVNEIEQESGITINDFSSPLIYRVIDHYGNYKEYKVTVLYSGLPVLYINTPESAIINSKTTWTEETMIKIVNPDGSVVYNGMSSIRGRGNSSWRYPKKSYAIKLDKKASILGMPKHKRWVLLANWMDRTLMRNRIAFKLGECTQMAYTPRGEYVEVILNDKHIGNYFLCEQIKIDENRLNIAEINAESKDLTGGYLLELDMFFDESYKFKSTTKNLPYMFKDPDENITDDMFNYLQKYINTLENCLYNHFETDEWKEYIDLNSFVDYWFAVELTSNTEPGHPKSVYMYKDRGGKLCAGPMWDYDWNTFTPNKSEIYTLKLHLYYPALFNDEDFIERVKERWPAAKANFDKVADFIELEAEKIRNSEKINSTMWPINQSVNGDESMSFDEAVDRLKKSYIDKLEWLDLQIRNM